MTGFSALVHPMAPRWMTGAIDRVMAGCPDVHVIEFDFWPVAQHRDRPTLHGHASFHGEDGRTVADEVLDEVPGVRILERRAVELWSVIPMTFSEDEGVSLNGAVSLRFRRPGAMEMSYHPDNWESPGSCMSVEAERGADGSWSIREMLVMDHYDGSVSDLFVDASAAMRSYDVSGMGLVDHPEALSVHVDDEGLHHFELVPGELSRLTPER